MKTKMGTKAEKRDRAPSISSAASELTDWNIQVSAGEIQEKLTQANLFVHVFYCFKLSICFPEPYVECLAI